jgi:hypothetical protein
MNTFNTTLLALCCCDMFQPSKGHPQGARLNFTSGAYLVGLAEEMYQCSLRMAL